MTKTTIMFPASIGEKVFCKDKDDREFNSIVSEWMVYEGCAEPVVYLRHEGKFPFPNPIMMSDFIKDFYSKS